MEGSGWSQGLGDCGMKVGARPAWEGGPGLCQEEDGMPGMPMYSWWLAGA